MSSINVKKRLIDLLRGSKAQTGFYGFSDLTSNTDNLVEQIFTAPTYSDAERQRLAAWFAAKDSSGSYRNTVQVLPEYPRTVAQLPAIFVFRIGDAEPPRSPLGDFLDEENDDDFRITYVRGTYLTEQIKLSLWALGDGAQRDDLYLAMREIIIRGRQYLHDAGIEVAEWQSGRDGQLYQPDYEPHIIHTAQVTIRCRTKLSWEEREPVALEIITHLKGYNEGQVGVSTWHDER